MKSIRGKVGQVWNERYLPSNGNILLLRKMDGQSWACLITNSDGSLTYEPKISLDAVGKYACKRIV